MLIVKQDCQNPCCNAIACMQADGADDVEEQCVLCTENWAYMVPHVVVAGSQVCISVINARRMCTRGNLQYHHDNAICNKLQYTDINRDFLCDLLHDFLHDFLYDFLHGCGFH